MSEETTISIVWNKDNIFIDSNEEEACGLVVPLADSFIQVCLHAKMSLTDMQEFIRLRHDKAIFHLEDTEKDETGSVAYNKLRSKVSMKLEDTLDYVDFEHKEEVVYLKKKELSDEEETVPS